MRKKIIAGNWKMNKTPQEAKELIELLKPLIQVDDKADVVFCPSFVCLSTAVEAVEGTGIRIGAQNLLDKDSGAYTGEVSPAMLKGVGCEYVILGHSERRAYFGETDLFINAKVKKAYEYGLTPIICVGETLEQREQGITEELVRMQTKIALLDIPAEQAAQAVIAYEPVWAIGTGRTATAEQAQEVCGAIRKVLTEIYGEETAQTMRIQYGGSMNAKNAAELLAMPDIDGGLIGGASLKSEFAEVVAAAQK
jgi:triosephosphate isomerase